MTGVDVDAVSYSVALTCSYRKPTVVNTLTPLVLCLLMLMLTIKMRLLSVIFVDEDGVRFAFALDDIDDGFTDILTDDNVSMTVLMMLLLLTVVADDDICY